MDNHLFHRVVVVDTHVHVIASRDKPLLPHNEPCATHGQRAHLEGLDEGAHLQRDRSTRGTKIGKMRRWPREERLKTELHSACLYETPKDFMEPQARPPQAIYFLITS